MMVFNLIQFGEIIFPKWEKEGYYLFACMLSIFCKLLCHPAVFLEEVNFFKNIGKFNPYKPRVLFVGHRQTVQTKTSGV